MKDRITKIKSTFLLGPAILCLIIFILDQVSKVMTVAATPMPFTHTLSMYKGEQVFIAGETLSILIGNVFHLVDFRNPGAAWGIFGDHTEVLALISFAAFLYLLWDFEGLCGKSKFRQYTISLLMGGIIGNGIDRGFREGGVVDMFQVYIPVPSFASDWAGVYPIDGLNRYIFPAFNIADAAICVATITLLISSFFIKDEKAEEQKTEKQTEANP